MPKRKFSEVDLDNDIQENETISPPRKRRKLSSTMKNVSMQMLLKPVVYISNTSLNWAIKMGHTQTARYLVDAGADINKLDSTRRSPLAHAAYYGNVEIAQYLIDSGANLYNLSQKRRNEIAKGKSIDSLQLHYYTPLHLAAIHGHVEIARLLLNAGAKVSVLMNDKASALHIAAKYGHHKFAKVLIQHGADIEQEYCGQTPITIAHNYRRDKVVALLKKCGAIIPNDIQDVVTESNIEPSTNITSSSAVSQSNPLIGFLFKPALYFWHSPLEWAVKNNYIQLARNFIYAGADVNARMGVPKAPLSIAATRGYHQMAQLLIDAGADVNGCSANDRKRIANGENINSFNLELVTPLGNAAFQDDSKMADVLIEKGANVHVNMPFGSALHIAAFKSHLEIIKILLRHNANVNSIYEGITPLHEAAERGHSHAVQLLIAAGANINQETKRGLTALYIAAERGHSNVVQTLLHHGAIAHFEDERHSPIVAAFENGYLNIVTLLRRNGAILPERFRNQRGEFNVKQSTHTVSVHISVSESAKTLRTHYPSANLVEARNNLFSWLEKALANEDSSLLTHPPSAAKRWITDPKHIDFIDSRSEMPTLDLLGYLWIGLHDKREVLRTSIEEKNPKKANAIFENNLLEVLTKGFYEIQRAYNLSESGADDGEVDSVTCAPGTFNGIMQILNTRHSKVEIRQITPQTIAAQAEVFVDHIFKNLNESEKQAVADAWIADTGIPLDFYHEIKDEVRKKLLMTFEEFREEVYEFDTEIENVVMNLEYLTPTTSVEEFIKLKVRTLLLFSEASSSTHSSFIADAVEDPKGKRPSLNQSH